MRSVAFLAAVLLASASHAQPKNPQPPKAEVPKPTGTGKRVAVLVGVNGYQDAQFPNLAFAEADMRALKEKLEAAGFDVILLLGSGTGDAEANRTNIIATLIDKREENKRFAFRDVTGPDDQILVAFSGHGEQIEVEEGDGDGKTAKREVPHFCPKRAESGKPSTQISLNDVLKVFQSSKAKSLLLVDACRVYSSNKEGTKGAVLDRKRVDALRPNVGGMFAASDRQAAREHEKEGHGLFFAAVLNAMDHEKSRDQDGNVVWSRMTDEIGDAVAKRSKELFPGLKDDEHQVPQPFGGFSRKFLLAAGSTSAAPPMGKEPLPPPPPPPAGKDQVTIETATSGYINSDQSDVELDKKVIRAGTKATILDRDEKKGMFFLKFEDGTKAWVREDCCSKPMK